MTNTKQIAQHAELRIYRPDLKADAIAAAAAASKPTKRGRGGGAGHAAPTGGKVAKCS